MNRRKGRAFPSRGILLAVSAGFLLGLGSGFLVGRRKVGGAPERMELPPLRLNVSYGDLGPRLLELGVVDYDRMVAASAQRLEPLTEDQKRILKEGGNEPVVIERSNAQFLLDFFWAVGLANRNPILTDGPMKQRVGGDIRRYASTGGWGLGVRPVADLYAAEPLIRLSEEQQALLERVAARIYRPCCDNPAAFPDCNHGMAMLGLLSLLASEGATGEELFEAAKYANTVWFPSQYQTLGAFFSTSEDTDLVNVEPERLLAGDISSRSGYGRVVGYLARRGLLSPVPGQAGSAC